MNFLLVYDIHAAVVAAMAAVPLIVTNQDGDEESDVADGIGNRDTTDDSR